MIGRPRQRTRSQLEERRLEAGRLLQAGHLSQAAIARQLGVSRTAVHRWAQPRQRSQGALRRLHRRRVPGRPPHLTPEQWQWLLQVLRRGALQAGFDPDRWTLRRIRAVMLVACGVADHAHARSHRLNTLGWSPQHPAVYARARDDALVQAWLTPDWARIKKTLAAEARHSSSSMTPACRFAPRPARLGRREDRHRSCGA